MVKKKTSSHFYWGSVITLLLAICGRSEAQTELAFAKDTTAVHADVREKVIIDNDIGMDIDDAFAVAFALDSPELEVVGFSTASGDTLARARIIDRMLGESGHAGIPVAVGIPTAAPDKSFPEGIIGLQKRYGETGRYVKASHPSAVEFILEKIRQYPAQITLVAIGPLSNVGALIDKDLGTFRKLKRVVMMGGQIAPIVDSATGQIRAPSLAEYNILLDIHSAQKLFASGVPIFVIPLDSTINLALDEVKRERVFVTSKPLTDSLALLYLLWNQPTPILFDVMAVAYLVKPELCPMEPVRLSVDDQGVTRVGEGTPNADVCMHSNTSTFFNYVLQRIIGISTDQSDTLVSEAGKR